MFLFGARYGNAVPRTAVASILQRVIRRMTILDAVTLFRLCHQRRHDSKSVTINGDQPMPRLRPAIPVTDADVNQCVLPTLTARNNVT